MVIVFMGRKTWTCLVMSLDLKVLGIFLNHETPICRENLKFLAENVGCFCLLPVMKIVPQIISHVNILCLQSITLELIYVIYYTPEVRRWEYCNTPLCQNMKLLHHNCIEINIVG